MTREQAIGSVTVNDDGTHSGSGLTGAMFDVALAAALDIQQLPVKERVTWLRANLLPQMAISAEGIYEEIVLQFVGLPASNIDDVRRSIRGMS